MKSLNKIFFKEKTLSKFSPVCNDTLILNKLQVPLLFDPKLCKSFEKDPVEYLSNLSPHKKSILDFLIFLTYKHRKLWPNQTTIARFAGISREYCNRLLQEMADDGLFTKVYRHMTSCLYKVSSFFTKPEMRSKIGYILVSLKAVSLAIVTQYNLGYKEYNKLSYTTKKIVPAQTRKGGSVYDFDNKPIATRVNPISESIRNLKNISLSKWGQIKLSGFPDQAIEYAAQRLQYFKDIRSPFNCFFKLCLDYCADNDIQPDWEWVKQLSVKYNMPENPVLILPPVQQAPEIPKREVPTRPAQTGYMGITPTLIYKAPELPTLTRDQAEKELNALNQSLHNESVQKFMNLIGKGAAANYLERLERGIKNRPQ